MELPFPSPGDLSNPQTEPHLLHISVKINKLSCAIVVNRKMKLAWKLEYLNWNIRTTMHACVYIHIHTHTLSFEALSNNLFSFKSSYEEKKVP